MAGLHPPGDPYFPNQGNNGWLEESEEEPEDDLEEEEIEEGPAEPMADDGQEEPGDDSDDDSDAESMVINRPYPVRVSAYRVRPSGPTPPWGINIWRWSRQQAQ